MVKASGAFPWWSAVLVDACAIGCAAAALLWPGAAVAFAGALPVLGFVALILQRLEQLQPRDARGGPARVLVAVSIGWALGGTGLLLGALALDDRGLGVVLAITAGVLLALVHGEILVRSLLRWALPAPVAGAPVARWDCSLLRPIVRGAAGASAPVRRPAGLDLRDSWAFRFVRRAAPWYGLLLLLGAWLCTGLTGLPPDRRGIYERCGHPHAVWGPGLHWHLPWPFGRVERVEYGTVHRLVLADVLAAADAPPPAGLPAVEARSDRWLDRLWERAHGRELHFLTAGPAPEDADERARRPFELINADVVLLWRVGSTADDALAFAYGGTEPAALLRCEARRWVQSVFASATPLQLIGRDRAAMARRMAAALQRSCRTLGLGIEIVDVHFEAIHPPIEAALSFYEVQAAEREAVSQIAAARARAEQIVASARVQAGVAADEAGAARAELVSAAQARAAASGSERHIAAAFPRVFRLERHLEALGALRSGAGLTLVDHRLAAGQPTTLDLRSRSPVAPRLDLGEND